VRIGPVKGDFRAAARGALGPAKTDPARVGFVPEKAVVSALEKSDPEKTVRVKAATRAAAKADSALEKIGRVKSVPARVDSVPAKGDSDPVKAAAVSVLERVDFDPVKAAVTVPEALRAGATAASGPVESGPVKGDSGPVETDPARGAAFVPVKVVAVTALEKPVRTVPREKVAAAGVPALSRRVPARTGVISLR